MRFLASWCLTALSLPPPESIRVVERDAHTPSHAFLVSSSSSFSVVDQGATLWLASSSSSSITSSSTTTAAAASTTTTTPQPPSKADIQLLREAFAEFYGVNRNLETSQQLLTNTINRWEATQQPPDERAALYRVRGDCDMLLGQLDAAVSDYTQTISLLQGPGGDKADPAELPAALLGRARAIKSKQQQGSSSSKSQTTATTTLSNREAAQAASDYETALKLSSREEWDTDQELLEDGATRNPFAAWEWGSVLRICGKWKEAARAHVLASNAFEEIGDRARSVISLLDAGIDLAADGNDKEAVSVLKKAIAKTKGVEGRDVELLQRVIAKEGEGRIVLAAVLWDEGQRGEAEGILGDACIRLEQLQADAAQRQSSSSSSSSSSSNKDQGEESTANTPAVRLQYSIDDDILPLDMSCYRFKNEAFLTELGLPDSLQKKVIKLQKLR